MDYVMKVPADRFFIKEDHYKEMEKMCGMKAMPVNMHRQPVYQGKDEKNLEMTAEAMRARVS